MSATITTLSEAPDTDTSGELAALVAEINVAHAAFERASQRAIMSAHHAGCLLLEAKSKVGHGGWRNWLKTYFAGDERTAQRYMRLARSYPDTTRLSDLTLTEALEAMAKPKHSEAESEPEPDEGNSNEAQAQRHRKSPDEAVSGLVSGVQRKVDALARADVGTACTLADDETREEWVEALARSIRELNQMKRAMRAAA